MPTTYYQWDPISDNIVAERDENGNVIVEYTTEPGYHGAVISEHRSGQTYYHHHDAQGNLRALTNDQGEVTDTFAYNASGEVTERTGNTPTPYQFGGEHGYYTDLETGQVMVRRRAYQPAQGRWLSVDPFPFGALVSEWMPWMRNAYGYCDNNPVNKVDPSGLQAAAPGVPARPVGLWTCMPPHRMESLRVDESYYTLNCLPCTRRCRLNIYGQRCFHESVNLGDDSDPSKAYTVMYAEFEYTRGECLGVPLPNKTYQIGGCELYPLRLIAPDNPLDMAVQNYLEEVGTCRDFDFHDMCDELRKVPPTPPVPGK